MKVCEVLDDSAHTLKSNDIVDSALESEVLLRHALDLDRASLYANLNTPLAADERQKMDRLIRRRLDREPLAYILGYREFYGLEFEVDPRVLIPRQETELLVDLTVDFASRGRSEAPLVIADVCTGSGAVAISLAVVLRSAILYATDLSREALEVADANKRKHGVEQRVHLLHGDLLNILPGPVDVIVANPPYLRSGEITDLTPEVRREPLCALDGGPSGLEVIERLLRNASQYVNPGGAIFIEIAPEQSECVARMARGCFPAGVVTVVDDLTGSPRVVMLLQENDLVPVNTN